MRQLFISYARENKPNVEALVRDLDALGYQTWVDFALRGGQTWWDEILRRIAASDVFVAIISPQSLSSVACKRELEWALALGKPVLPLAVGRLPDALPRALSMRQIVDYSTSSREAAFALAGALANLPDAPPPPSPLPKAPPAPLSYLSDLVDQVGKPEPMTHEQQREVLIHLQPALHSSDAEEHQGGRYILDMLSRRDDLFADVALTVQQLGQVEYQSEPAATPSRLPAAPGRGGPGRGGPGRGVKIALVAAAVVLVGAIAVVAVLMTRGDGGERSSGASSQTPTYQEEPTSPADTMSPTSAPPPRTTSSTSTSASLTGTWSGRVSGDQSLEVIADIVDGPPLTAQVRYPQANCVCTWTEKPSASEGVRLVTEKVVSGSCVQSEVTLVPQDDGTLHFSSTYYSKSQQRNLTIEGTLRRSAG